MTSKLIPTTFDEFRLTAGVAAESRKHAANDPKLGLTCVPLAVEAYGKCGREVEVTFSRLTLIDLSLLQAKVCLNQRQQLALTPDPNQICCQGYSG